MTGLDTETYRKWATADEFDHFLVKPVNPDVITALLRVYARARFDGADANGRGAS